MPISYINRDEYSDSEYESSEEEEEDYEENEENDDIGEEKDNFDYTDTTNNESIFIF